jgi:hypothetical protein
MSLKALRLEKSKQPLVKKMSLIMAIQECILYLPQNDTFVQEVKSLYLTSIVNIMSNDIHAILPSQV